MKSGRKIFLKLRSYTAVGKEIGVRALSNGDLRSLSRYLSKAEFDGDVKCNEILGLAIVEGFRRWLDKGKGKNL